MVCEHAHEASVLRRVVDTVPALVGYWDTASRNVAANDACLEFFGLTLEQVQGMHIRDVLGPDAFERNRRNIEGVLGGVRQQFDRILIDVHGRTRHTQATYVPDEVDGLLDGSCQSARSEQRRIRRDGAEMLAGWSDCADHAALIAAADADTYMHKRLVDASTNDASTAVHPSRGHLTWVMSSPG